MLEKSASGVLASFRPSTYPSGYALYLGIVVHETHGTGQIDTPPVRRDRGRAGSSRSPPPKPEQLPGPPSPHRDKDGLHQGGGDADTIGFCRD
jgi:hypothetical protein